MTGSGMGQVRLPTWRQSNDIYLEENRCGREADGGEMKKVSLVPVGDSTWPTIGIAVVVFAQGIMVAAS